MCTSISRYPCQLRDAYFFNFLLHLMHIKIEPHYLTPYHYEKWEDEYKSKQQQKGNKTMMENLVKRKQHFIIRRGLGHYLTFFRWLAIPYWKAYLCTRKKWEDQTNIGFLIPWGEWHGINEFPSNKKMVLLR